MLWLLRRVILLVVLLSVLFGVFVAAGLVVGRPVVEDRVKSAVSGQLGSPVGVSFSGSTRGWLRGNVGDVTATAPRIKRGDLEVQDVRIVLHDSHLQTRKLLSRKVVIDHKGIDASGAVTEDELNAYARPLLQKSTNPVVRDARVVITNGKVALRSGTRTVPLTISVTKTGDLRIAPAKGAGAIARPIANALREPVTIGALPYGLVLKSAKVDGQRLALAGDAPAGRIEIS